MAQQLGEFSFVLAAVGEHEVSVVRRPRVGVLSTGDEIVAPHERAGPGQVFDSNARAIADAFAADAVAWRAR